MLLCVNSIKSLATSSWTEKKQAATAVRTNLHAVDDDSTHLFFHSLLLSIGKLCMACTRSAVITHQSTKLCKCNLIIVLTVVKFFVVGIFSLEPWINWHFSERASESLATCINYEFGKMRTNALLLSMMTMMMIMCVYVTSAIRVSLSIEKKTTSPLNGAACPILMWRCPMIHFIVISRLSLTHFSLFLLMQWFRA